MPRLVTSVAVRRPGTRLPAAHGAWRTPGLLGCALLAVVLLAACATGQAASRQSATGSRDTTVSVSAGECGKGWTHPRTGLQTFQLHNESSGAAEVYLINPLQGSLDTDSASAPVFAEIEDLGPGTTTPMQVNVGSGAYAFECELQHYGTIIGPIVRLPGSTPGTPDVLSVTFSDLLGAPNDPLAPARAYRAYVSEHLTVLVRQTDALRTAVRDNELAIARSDWLTAHLTYEQMGAAYGTFGAFDSEIDGRADGWSGGVHNPHFSGFYRIEYGLWHGESATELVNPADQLLHDVRGLQAAFPRLQLVLSDLGLRTHEILENAVQFQLTGHDDYGSGTTLATTLANIQGTFELVSVLHPLLVTRYTNLPQVYSWLNRLQRLVQATRLPNGQWTAVSRLSTPQREQIDAAAGQALQELAPIAAIFEVEKQP
jgi:iron uptake system component EfeO